MSYYLSICTRFPIGNMPYYLPICTQFPIGTVHRFLFLSLGSSRVSITLFGNVRGFLSLGVFRDLVFFLFSSVRHIRDEDMFYDHFWKKFPVDSQNPIPETMLIDL